MNREAPIDAVDASVYRFPTPEPEADGTLEWDATVAVVVEVSAGGKYGLGWTYSSPAAAQLIRSDLTEVVMGQDAMAIGHAWTGMRRAVRNLGSAGLAMQAISAVDIALWDLKARLLDINLTALLGGSAQATPVYGSGGFTTLNDRQLAAQIEQWQTLGCTAMKIKIGELGGTRVRRDLARATQLATLAGPNTDLMADANGAYRTSQARRVGKVLDDLGFVWFEEPVSSQDLDGLRNVRSALQCDIAAGEYVCDAVGANQLAEVVDCLQLDVTRCGGYTGFLQCAAIAKAHCLTLSAHCAPSLHAPLGGVVDGLRNIEFFADHARLEPQLADPVPDVRDGRIRPLSGPGHGMLLRHDVSKWEI